MGLTDEKLWGLCSREIDALKRVRSQAHEFQLSMVAAIRADIHNTAGKSFDRVVEPSQFMPGGGASSVEERARELMAQGVEPSRAVAMASITQNSKHRLHLVKTVMDASEQRSKKTKGTGRRRMKPAG